MKKYYTCPNCNGTGYENHKYVRNDGEVVVERINWECCNGIGKVKDFINEVQTGEEVVAKANDSLDHNYKQTFGLNNEFDDQY